MQNFVLIRLNNGCMAAGARVQNVTSSQLLAAAARILSSRTHGLFIVKQNIPRCVAHALSKIWLRDPMIVKGGMRAELVGIKFHISM